MITWEYRVVALEDGGNADLAYALADAGDEGWEAFAVMPAAGSRIRVFLKRMAGPGTVTQLLATAVSMAAAERHRDSPPAS